MTNMETNRRRYRRVPASFQVFSRAEPRVFYSVQDISLGGAQVHTMEPLPPGTPSIFGLQLPHHEVPLEVRGHVVWSRSDKMGVAFDDVVAFESKSDDAVAPLLTAFLEKLEREAIAS
jgi:hypothetical protein